MIQKNENPANWLWLVAIAIIFLLSISAGHRNDHRSILQRVQHSSQDANHRISILEGEVDALKKEIDLLEQELEKALPQEPNQKD